MSLILALTVVISLENCATKQKKFIPQERSLVEIWPSLLSAHSQCSQIIPARNPIVIHLQIQYRSNTHILQ